MIHHVTRATRILLFWGLLAIAASLSLFRIALATSEHYRELIEQQLSQELGAELHIGKLRAGMRRFRPELVLKDLRIDNKQTQVAAIKVAELHSHINLLHIFDFNDLLHSAGLSLIGVQVTLERKEDGQIVIKGMDEGPQQAPPSWLLQTARIEVIDSHISWHDLQMHQHAELDQVNVLVRNNSRQEHQIQLTAEASAELAQQLQIIGSFQGNSLKLNELNAHAYLKATKLQLSHPYLKGLGSYKVHDGHADLQLWTEWKEGQLASVTGHIQAAQITLSTQKNQELTLPALSQNFSASRFDNAWKLVLVDLNLTLPGLTIQNMAMDVELQNSGAESSLPAISKVYVQAQKIDLQKLNKLLDFSLEPTSSLHRLADVSATLEDVHLVSFPEAARFGIQAKFDHLAYIDSASKNGVTHVSGSLKGDQNRGRIKIDSHDFNLLLPGVFSKNLPFNSVKGEATWRQSLSKWIVRSPSILFDEDGIQMNTKVAVGISKQDQSVEIDMTSAFKGQTSVKSFTRYLPNGQMGKDAVAWLDQAFLNGHVRPSGAILKGKLADFPYHGQQGVFQLAFDLVDVDLHFASGWPVLSKVNAEVLFNQEGMQVNAQKLSAQNFNFERFAVEVKSFASSDYLTIQGYGKGDIDEVLDYLAKSPLSQNIQDVQKVIRPKGLTELDLGIKVPLVDQAKFQVEGQAQLKNVDFSVIPLGLPVSQTHGTLVFNDQGLSSGALEAKALNQKMTATLKNHAQQLQLEVKGLAKISELQKQFKSPLWQYAEGGANFGLTLNIPENPKQASSLALNSNMKGIALDLPDILGKNFSEIKNLDIKLKLAQNDLSPVSIDFGKDLHSEFQVDLQRMKLHGGQLSLGHQSDEDSKHKNNLSIRLDRFSPEPWLAFISHVDSPADKSAFDGITLDTQHLLWKDQDLGPLKMSMEAKQQMWKIQVDSHLLQGAIERPISSESELATVLNLDYLNLSGLSQLNSKQEEDKSVTSKRLPLFNLDCSKVYWEQQDLGSLKIRTQRITHGIEFSELLLSNPQGQLSIKGNWIANAAEQSTTAIGKLNMRNFGSFLKGIGLTNDLVDTDAGIEFAVNWPGAPQRFNLAGLDGRVDINLKNGRILSIEPGFGRVLGLVALEQWGRRLRLDFADMINQGLTFNSISGHFDVTKGNARTDNLEIDAIPAMINIDGSVYLPEHRLKLHVKVLPKSSAALPIAGTIVDKVMTFAVETLTGTSQEGFLLGSEYQLRGTWDNPEVTQLHEHDGLLPKTWSGLTDFSWLIKKNPNNTTKKTK